MFIKKACVSVLLIAAFGLAHSRDLFVDAAKDSGIDFVHFNGMTGDWYFAEMMGAGAALFDYDNDGDLDIYLCQGNMLPGESADNKPLISPSKQLPLSDRLYRNDGTSADGHLVFSDVTQSAGLSQTGYGMGIAIGDINNDGWLDIYLTNLGENRLLMNRGGKKFDDITDTSGTGDEHWSVSASFVDIDRDDDLDLYVGNYVNFGLTNHKPCRSASSARDYCSPLVYTPSADKLYRNDGGGRFVDISAAAGISDASGAALGVIADDFDGDGWTDIYVANDGSENQLWINQKDSRFENNAVFAGVAVNMDGNPEASMGVDAADFDADGDIDLFMTHLARETNTLYVNDGDGWFEDRSLTMGLAGESFSQTGFGVAWIDYDNDRWLDLLISNGAVMRIPEQKDSILPLRQKNQLFRNVRGEKFQEVSAVAGSAFGLSEVSRGAAFGDIDNDGDTDVVITNNNGPVRLLINTAGSKNAWLGIRLTDERGQLVTHGAKVAIVVDRDTEIWRRVGADGSYASANDARVLIGLGNDRDEQSIRVVWSDGKTEIWSGLKTGMYHDVHRGSGQPVD